MSADIQNNRKIIEYFVHLIRFDGDVSKFWDEYLKSFCNLLGADKAILTGLVDGEWKVANYYSESGEGWDKESVPKGLAEQGLNKKLAVGKVDENSVIAVALDVGPQEQPPVLLLNLGRKKLSISENTIFLIASIPSLFQAMRLYKKARTDVLFFAKLLQVVSSVSGDEKFGLASIRLCNEIASLFNCDQVSLGWQKGGGVKLKSISNMESFEYRANSVMELEGAMEESIDQDAEILWPGTEDSKLRMNSHEAYGSIRRVGSIVTLPLRLGSKILGAVTCEREKGVFSEDEIWRLRLLLEQVSRWLEILADDDKWFGLRIYDKIRKNFNRLFTIEKTGLKILIFSCLFAAAVMAVPMWNYSVDGTFIMKADKTVHITSPTDGYIEKVYVRPGDSVKKGSELVSLDMKELLMEQASLVSKLAKHQREAEKAEASNSLADMRIAQLMAEETLSQMDIVSFKINNSMLKAPFAGVVVEGDLKSNLGAPVRQGDVLMKISSLRMLTLEILVDEKDIYDFNIDAQVIVKFVGKPESEYTAKVTKIIPQVISSGSGNVFTVLAKTDYKPQKWWRPGMSGVVKIRAGKHSLWWIITHEAIDFIKLNFWL